MKRKLLGIVLFVFTLLSAFGVFALVITNFDEFGNIFSNTGSSSKVLIYIALLLLCWAICFILLVRLNNNGSVFGYGRKDFLTGLGNKKALKSEYEKSGRNANKYVCIGYISYDAEKFAYKNGEELNNKLQKDVSEILKSKCNDDELVVRIRNGLFAMLLRGGDGLRSQKRIEDTVLELNRYQIKYYHKNIIPFKAGIAFSVNGVDKFENLFDNASVAYRYAFNENRDYVSFTDKLLDREEQRKRLYNKFSKAIENNEFDMFIQFIKKADSGKFIGAEVLSRWNSAENGFVMPAYYIKDMQNCGIIETFDVYMLGKTCKQLQEWSNDKDFSGLSLSCNVTRVTISSKNFFQNLKRIVNQYEFDRSKLIIEITEDALIEDMLVAFENISAAKELGVKIAIDDFGSGTSSLNDINSFPIDQLKIDREFIYESLASRGIGVIRGLVEMAHELNIDVACEGIETEKQYKSMLETGCDYIQGYYFSYVYPMKEAKERYLRDDLAKSED